MTHQGATLPNMSNVPGQKPEVKEQKDVLNLIYRVCLGLSGAMQLLLHEQLQEATSQFAELQSIAHKQTAFSGADSLGSLQTPDAKEAPRSSLFFDDQDGDWGLIEREGKTSLSPQAAKLLVSVFAFADSLDKAQLTGLAHNAGCSEKQVRAFFSKLRTSTRAAIQKAHKRAEKELEPSGGLPLGSRAPGLAAAQQQEWQQHHRLQLLGSSDIRDSFSNPAPTPGDIQVAGPSGAAAAAAGAQPLTRAALLQVQQQQQLEHLRNLLDGSGAISSVSNAGHFLLSMQRTSSYQARAQHLSALAATTNMAVLLRLAGSKLLDTFSTWLTEAAEDGQLTFLKQALDTLQQLPISTALLQASSITSTVNALVHHHCPSVIIAAYQLAKHWSSITSLATLDALGPLVYGIQEPVRRSSSGGSGSHGGASKAAAGTAGSSGKGLGPVGPGGVLQRRYNAAVKKKVRELQMVPGFGGGASAGGASRWVGTVA